MTTAINKDPISPDQSHSAASIPSIYDTYLCEEVLERHPLLRDSLLEDYGIRLRVLHSAANYFFNHNQFRAYERLQLEIAREHLRNEEWSSAIRVLTPLWQNLSWREAGWWRLVEEVDWTLRECARKLGDTEILVAVEWEQLSNCFRVKAGHQYDFYRCLEGVNSLDSRPKIVVYTDKIKSCLSSSFSFVSARGTVGETLFSQLTIESKAHRSSDPIFLTRVRVAFEGGLGSIQLGRETEQKPETIIKDGPVHLYNVSLQKVSDIADAALSSCTKHSRTVHTLLGTSDLMFVPGATKIFAFEIVPRESREVEVISITMCVDGKDFDFEIVNMSGDHLQSQYFWYKKAGRLSKMSLRRDNSGVIEILPKSPKLLVEIPNLKKQYIVDERAQFLVNVVNEEDSEVNAIIKVRVLGHIEKIEWITEEVLERNEQVVSEEILDNNKIKSLETSLGHIASGETRQRKFTIHAAPEAAECLLKIEVFYNLSLEPETPVVKRIEARLVFVRPFEISYDFTPGIYTLWPNYFSIDDNVQASLAPGKTSTAGGVVQTWSLTSIIASYAIEAIRIEQVRLHFIGDQDQALCTISQMPESASGDMLLMPDCVQSRLFDINVQKYNVGDPQSVILNLKLEIQWRREGPDAATTITSVTVPETVLLFGEPRVLISLLTQENNDEVIYLEYSIENPSMHLLTFSLSMETSDAFAFSGLKTTSIHLVPLSRQSIAYQILPFVKGTWITPQFKVMDMHFNTMLKVHATKGIRNDKKGTHIWVDAEE